MNTPKLTVVGSGPGNPELITLKAIKTLRLADVVLYDALVDKALLSYAPLHSEKIFVGKQRGKMVYQQEQINELIVNRALNSGHVVRLKGGDPFIFGRGLEEIEYAMKYNLETAVVPGISSSTAVSTSQNISLTKRGVSESFWAITGVTKDGNISEDITLAAKSKATIVILMGMNKLQEITEVFKKQGKDKLPVAVIQNGTTKYEKTGIGTIDTIQHIVKKRKLSSPAIIVIGDVVSHRKKQNKIIVRMKKNKMKDDKYYD